VTAARHRRRGLVAQVMASGPPLWWAVAVLVAALLFDVAAVIR
jgi:hypothetical protein